eukprot:1137556-Pelagomonas_calceolata.AAC.7
MRNSQNFALVTCLGQSNSAFAEALMGNHYILQVGHVYQKTKLTKLELERTHNKSRLLRPGV